jgi:hypothetical protein
MVGFTSALEAAGGVVITESLMLLQVAGNNGVHYFGVNFRSYLLLLLPKWRGVAPRAKRRTKRRTCILEISSCADIAETHKGNRTRCGQT